MLEWWSDIALVCNKKANKNNKKKMIKTGVDKQKKKKKKKQICLIEKMRIFK